MKVIDFEIIDSIRELQGDDDPNVLASIVDIYLTTLLERMAKIQLAIESNDPKTLEMETHSLKSSSASLGGAETASFCKELEKLGHDGNLTRAPELYAKLKAASESFVTQLESLPELQEQKGKAA